MRVFLTGGTGFIGQRLAAALRRRGWDVTAPVRDETRGEARALVALGATLARGAVTDREPMRAPVARAAAVVHAAGWYEVGIGGGDAERRMEAHFLSVCSEFIMISGATGKSLLFLW